MFSAAFIGQHLTTRSTKIVRLDNRDEKGSGRLARVLAALSATNGPLLLKAGFARGDHDYLLVTVESIGRLASRIG